MAAAEKQSNWADSSFTTQRMCNHDLLFVHCFGYFTVHAVTLYNEVEALLIFIVDISVQKEPKQKFTNGTIKNSLLELNKNL